MHLLFVGGMGFGLRLMFLAALVACAPAAVRADSVGEEYERAVSEGLDEYNAGNYLEARALFEQAHGLRPSARTQRGLGMTSFELKNYVRAQQELEKALAEQRNPLTGEQRGEVERLLTRVRRYICHLTVNIQGQIENAVMSIDGVAFTRQAELNLGEHELLVQAPGHRTLRRRMMLEGGQRQLLELRLEPLAISARDAARSAPAPTVATTAPATPSLFERWWFWTALGVVAAGGVVAAWALTAPVNKRELEPGDTGAVVLALEKSR